MELKNILRSTVLGGASLALALGLGSCSRDYTVAYVYSVSSSNGSISAFAVDYQTGILNQISGSPFQTTFTNPVTVVAAPNNKAVYVIGGSQNANVGEFAVGTDGKLYGEHTYDLTGTYPTAAAIDSTGTHLYVTYTYQNGFSPASPGPGGVTIYPINADNSLGTAINQNVGSNPISVAVAPATCVASGSALGGANATCTNLAVGSGVYNTYVYVLDQELTAAKPTVLGFAQNQTTGALTPLSGTNTTTFQGYSAGVVPSAIAVDGTSRFVYVTDQQANQIYGYGIASNTGNLTALSGSPFSTGLRPVSLTIDPRAKYVYTANFNSNSISSFAIDQATGNLATVSGGNFTTATGPTCITIDPALGQFLYTSNNEDGTLSGGQLSANTGQVSAVLDTPFPAGSLPSCLTSVANGSHATQQLTP